MIITVSFEVSDDFSKMKKIFFTPPQLKVESVKGLLQAGADAIEEQLEQFGDGLDLVNVAKIIVGTENKKNT